MQGSIDELEEQLRVQKEKYSKQKAVRWHLEMHLKDLYKDFQFLKRDTEAQAVRALQCINL